MSAASEWEREPPSDLLLLRGLLHEVLEELESRPDERFTGRDAKLLVALLLALRTRE